MLQRHHPTDRTVRGIRGRGTDPQATPAIYSFAASALSLPALENIRTRFSIAASDADLTNAAVAMVDAKILRPEHWVGDTVQSIAAALSDIAVKQRPDPWATLNVVMVDDLKKHDLDGDSNYNHKYKVETKRIGGLVVSCRSDHPVQLVIGHTIRALEAYRPRLGHAVACYLNGIFAVSSRALDSIEGYGWAQGNYWQGELDETYWLDEQLDDAEGYHHESENKKLPAKDRKPFDREAAIKEMDLFTKAKFDESIPLWAGSGHNKIKPMSLKSLQSIRVPPPFRKILKATIAAAQGIKRSPHPYGVNDICEFDGGRYEICPYLLRWTGYGDVLGQIWDDFLNNEYQNCETQMDVNAVFAFHDDRSMVKAIRRFEIYCRNLTLAENLLRSLNPYKPK
jgi:PRTRC genetic system protein F